MSVSIEGRALISVIIPAYNAANYIGIAINSALAQTYQPVEIIVIDDGSTDGTYQYVKDSFPTVRVETQPNGGPSVARNAGARIARGEYLAFLDADDLWAPTKLAEQLSAVQDIKEWGLCATRVIRFKPEQCYPQFETKLSKPKTVILSHRRILSERWSLWRKNHIITTSVVLVKKAVFDEVAGFDEDPGVIVAEDMDLYLRIAARWKAVMVAKPLVGYRVTAGSLSRNKLRMHANARNVLVKWVDVYPKLVPKLIRRRNDSMVRKLLRMGEREEAYRMYIDPSSGKKRSVLAFQWLECCCRFHMRFFKLK